MFDEYNKMLVKLLSASQYEPDNFTLLLSDD